MSRTKKKGDLAFEVTLKWPKGCDTLAKRKKAKADVKFSGAGAKAWTSKPTLAAILELSKKSKKKPELTKGLQKKAKKAEADMGKKRDNAQSAKALLEAMLKNVSAMGLETAAADSELTKTFSIPVSGKSKKKSKKKSGTPPKKKKRPATAMSLEADSSEQKTEEVKAAEPESATVGSAVAEDSDEATEVSLALATDSAELRAAIENDSKKTMKELRVALAEKRRALHDADSKLLALRSAKTDSAESGTLGVEMEVDEKEKMLLRIDKLERDNEELSKQLSLGLSAADTGDKGDDYFKLMDQRDVLAKENEALQLEIGVLNDKVADSALLMAQREGIEAEAKSQTSYTKQLKEDNDAFKAKAAADEASIARVNDELRTQAQELKQLREEKQALDEENEKLKLKAAECENLSKLLAQRGEELANLTAAAAVSAAPAAEDAVDAETLAAERVAVARKELAVELDAISRRLEEAEEYSRTLETQKLAKEQSLEQLSAERMRLLEDNARLQLAGGTDVDLSYHFDYSRFSLFKVERFAIEPRASRKELVRWAQHVTGCVADMHETYAAMLEEALAAAESDEDDDGWQLPLDTWLGVDASEAPANCWPQPAPEMRASDLWDYRPTKARLLQYIDIIFHEWARDVRQFDKELDMALADAGTSDMLERLTADDAPADVGVDAVATDATTTAAADAGDETNEFRFNLLDDAEMAQMSESISKAEIMALLRRRDEVIQDLKRELKEARREHTPSHTSGAASVGELPAIDELAPTAHSDALVKEVNEQFLELADGCIVVSADHRFADAKQLAYAFCKLRRDARLNERQWAKEKRTLQKRQDDDSARHLHDVRKNVTEKDALKVRLTESEARFQQMQEDVGASEGGNPLQRLTATVARMKTKLTEESELRAAAALRHADDLEKEKASVRTAKSEAQKCRKELEYGVAEEKERVKELMERETHITRTLEHFKRQAADGSNASESAALRLANCEALAEENESIKENLREVSRDLDKERVAAAELKERFEIDLQKAREAAADSARIGISAETETVLRERCEEAERGRVAKEKQCAELSMAVETVSLSKVHSMEAAASQMEHMRALIRALTGKLPRVELRALMCEDKWAHGRFDSTMSGHFRGFSEMASDSDSYDSDDTGKGVVTQMFDAGITAGAKVGSAVGSVAEIAMCRIKGVPTAAEREAKRKRRETRRKEKERKRKERRQLHSRLSTMRGSRVGVGSMGGGSQMRLSARVGARSVSRDPSLSLTQMNLSSALAHSHSKTSSLRFDTTVPFASAPTSVELYGDSKRRGPSFGPRSLPRKGTLTVESAMDGGRVRRTPSARLSRGRGLSSMAHSTVGSSMQKQFDQMFEGSTDVLAKSTSVSGIAGLPLDDVDTGAALSLRHERRATLDLDSKVDFLKQEESGSAIDSALGSFASTLQTKRKERKSSSRDLSAALRGADFMQPTVSADSTIRHESDDSLALIGLGDDESSSSSTQRAANDSWDDDEVEVTVFAHSVDVSMGSFASSHSESSSAPQIAREHTFAFDL